MKSMEIVKKIMDEKEIKPSVLAARLNILRNTLSSRFAQENVSVDKLAEMLRAIDYKIAIVPRDTRTPTGGYEVE